MIVPRICYTIFPLRVLTQNGHLLPFRHIPFCLAVCLGTALHADANTNRNKEKQIRLAYQAIQNNQLEQLKKLVQDGVRPDDYYGRNEAKGKRGIPLFLIAIEKRNLKIVDFFLKTGINPNSIYSGDGCFPLHTAAYVGDVKILNLLIQSGAQLDERGYTCESALTVATKQGHLEIIKTLLSAGATPRAIDNLDSGSLLMRAPNLATRKVLIEYGVDVNEIVMNKETALMYAIYDKNLPYVQLLIESGANLEISDKEGETALLKAAYLGESKILEILLKAGANPLHTNTKGQTALDIAKEESAPATQLGKNSDHKACVRALEIALKGRTDISPAGAQ